MYQIIDVDDLYEQLNLEELETKLTTPNGSQDPFIINDEVSYRGLFEVEPKFQTNLVALVWFTPNKVLETGQVANYIHGLVSVRSGRGVSLMEELIEEIGDEQLALHVKADNMELVEYYEALGFTYVTGGPHILMLR